MSIPREELYTYRVEWSEEDQEFVGTVAEFPSLSCLADSSLEALSGIQQVVLQAIDILEEEGKPVPEPYHLRRFSGRFNLRVSPQLHRKLSQQAAFAHQSLNQYVSQALEAAG
ncbi:toxin-antitoxin system HicB family antitoxin [Rothia aeria]|uniref:type II toxin-antitoxin system HicB family antitoxin n=1 Tax=Rothia aeria TaxID=172042 RepID=UPI0028F069F7|nr:toxin-antitoxin system HicB family antitoxin [Rothia aeria]